MSKQITCTLVYLVRNEKVLLGYKKRSYGSGRWNGVGGKVESDETIEAAMVRECEEEIGVVPTEYNQLAELIFYTPEETVTIHAFIATNWKGKPIETEEIRPEWYKVDNIPYDKMLPDAHLWLPKVLDGETLYGEFRVDKAGEVLDYSFDESDETL